MESVIGFPWNPRSASRKLSPSCGPLAGAGGMAVALKVPRGTLQRVCAAAGSKP
jgi:hypothetical protein